VLRLLTGDQQELVAHDRKASPAKSPPTGTCAPNGSGGNTIQDNRMSGAPAALLFNSLAPAGPMCGNVVTARTMVFVNDSGDYGDGAPSPDLTARCG
jgi:hypothetical protein